MKVTLLHLHDLPRHVQDAASCSAEEASQAGDGAISDHSTPYRLSFAIQQPPLLLSLLPLPQLQLPLLLMVPQPHQTLLLFTGRADMNIFESFVMFLKKRWRNLH